MFMLLYCSRFVLNVPKEDLQSFERILFLVENAHWFYEDNSVENNPSLKSLNLKEFTSLRILTITVLFSVFLFTVAEYMLFLFLLTIIIYEQFMWVSSILFTKKGK